MSKSMQISFLFVLRCLLRITITHAKEQEPLDPILVPLVGHHHPQGRQTPVILAHEEVEVFPSSGGGGGDLLRRGYTHNRHLQQRQAEVDDEKKKKQREKTTAPPAILHADAQPRYKYSYIAELKMDGDQTIQAIIDTGSVTLLCPSVECQTCVKASSSSFSSSSSASTPASFSPTPSTATAAPFNLSKATRTNKIACDDQVHCHGICDAGNLPPPYSSTSSYYCNPQGGLCLPLTNNTSSSSSSTGGKDDASSSSCATYVTFGDDAIVQGVVVQGPLQIAGIELNDALYGVITQATEAFDGSAGVLGLAPGDGCNDHTCFPTIFKALVEEKGLPNLFSICGNKDEPLMILGGSDEDLYLEDSLVYEDLVPSYYYTVQVAALQIAGQDAADVNATGIVDTGASSIILPDKAYQAFKTELQTNHCHIMCMCSNSTNGPGCQGLDVFEAQAKGEAFHIDDADVLTLPTLNFTLQNGANLTVASMDYLVLMKIDPKDQKRYYFINILSLAEADITFSHYVLGQPLLHRAYVEYDREHRRLGFGTAVPDCQHKLKRKRKKED